VAPVPPPSPTAGADGTVGYPGHTPAAEGLTTSEEVAFRAGQAAASAAVRAVAELAWEPARVAGDARPGHATRRVTLGGEPERAVLRAAVRAILAVAPFPLRTSGGGAVPEGVALAFEAGQRAILGGVATMVGATLRPARPVQEGRRLAVGAGRP
jgi:hypothetical protein